MKNAAVLGCGPAGLLAVHALNEYGIHADVFSIKRRSEISGAQYLHRAIPDITPEEPSSYIRFTKVGDRNGYAFKVYGDENAPVSWDSYDSGIVPMWSMEQAYARLWSTYHQRIRDMNVNAGVLADLAGKYDEVISTVPRVALCIRPGEHRFRQQFITIKHRSLPELTNRPNEVVYDGTPHVGWYRWSIINGHESAEYGTHRDRVTEDEAHLWRIFEGLKPLGHNCTCWESDPNITFAGRFGRWEKGVLIHHAYEQVKEVATNALHQVQH